MLSMVVSYLSGKKTTWLLCSLFNHVYSHPESRLQWNTLWL